MRGWTCVSAIDQLTDQWRLQSSSRGPTVIQLRQSQRGRLQNFPTTPGLTHLPTLLSTPVPPLQLPSSTGSTLPLASSK